MKILGLDPGLRNTGWGIIEKVGTSIIYVASGIITPNPKLSSVERLATLHLELLKVLNDYNPACVAIEQTFVNNNAVSSIKLGEARGVILMTPALKGLMVTEYAPNTIKKTVTGVGHADKVMIQKMVQMILPKSNILLQKKDVADALATALCHAYSVPNNYLKGER